MLLENMEKLDQKILKLLMQDGRMSFAEIGRELNLSRTAVRDRVLALQESGVIESFTCIIDPHAVGLKLSVLFEIECIPNRLPEAAAILAKNDYILSINQMTGKSLLHVHAAFRDTNHLDEFLNKVIYALPGLETVNTSILLRGFKTKMGGIKIN